MTLKSRFLLFVFLIVSGISAYAQVSFDSPAELEKAANEFFESKQYDKAKPLYSQLLSLNALDPNYNYRFGVCILYTESDPLKPLPYIEGGANTSGVNSEAYYFLGKAYQLNYRFEDAISYFEKAKNSGFSAAGESLDKSIEECRNGKLLFNQVEFEPAQNKEVIESEFYRPYDFRKLKGKVIPMPPSFKTKYDQKNLRGTVVYTPSNSQTLIYASYGEDGANGKDLYQVNRLPSGEWALPQLLPDNINTKYDEDYAFYDSQQSTLYFASKGHNTMGGYDIFRSIYSADDNMWSQPINLQYPINSPYDDFLYLSDPSGKVAFFTSKRESEIGKLRVFKTLLHDPSQVELSIVEGTYEDRTDSVFNYMMATVFDPKTNEVIGKYRSNKETGKYVLILPPQNDYKLDVGPNESAGFQFDLDVPKHEEAKTLQQEIAYDANDSDGTVTLTNYFNASGEKDSVALAANRNRTEVEKGMAALPDPSEILASRTKEIEVKKDTKAEVNKLAEMAALEEAKLMAELAKSDSIAKLKRLAMEAETQRIEAEIAKKDSILQAELAMKTKLAREKAVADSLAEMELALAAQREKAIADSISQAQDLARIEKSRLDSLAEVEAKLIAQEEKATADSIAKAELAAQKHQVLLDSLAEVELALAAQRKKAVADSISQAQDLARAQKARLDSLAEVEAKLVAQKKKATEDSITKAQELAAQKQQVLLDSLAEVELARAAQREKAEAVLLAERKKAVADSLMKAQDLAVLTEQARLDSLVQLELVAAEKAEQDSLLQIAEAAATEEERLARERLINDSIALAERVAFEAKLAAEKQQAEKDSLEASLTQAENTGEVEIESFDELLKEMQEKEAQILANQQQEKQDVADTTEVKSSRVEKPELARVEEVATADSDSTKTDELISEADLFLQTLAELEEQSEAQKQAVEDENERLAEERSAASIESTKIGQTGNQIDGATSKPTTGNQVVALSDSISAEVEETKDIETQSVALKSDANPDEYLAALAEMEAQMQADDAKNNKTYELIELEPIIETSSDVDPKLQQLIDADRKALEEHRRVAETKEKELQEQLARDKEVLSEITQPQPEDELAAIEAEMLKDLEVKKTGNKLKIDTSKEIDAGVNETQQVAEVIEIDSTKTVLEEEEKIVETDLIEEAEELVNELNVEETLEVDPKPSVKLPTEEAAEAAVVENENVESVIEEDVIAEADEAVQTEPNQEKELETLSEEEISTAKNNAVEDVIEEEVVQVKIEEEALIAEVDEAINEIMTEAGSEVENGAQTQDVAIPATETVERPDVQEAEELVSEEESVSTVEVAMEMNEYGQRIPFMEPALRDYSTNKPDFSAIENETLRRMVIRMRAEDVGRVAVLKNMKNQWVDQGKTQKSLATIKENKRNQDVLANLVEPTSREEKVREPFDKNDLRTRDGVYYQLEVNLVSASVSETIRESMTPEQEMTFAMPEFNISTDHFDNLADARAEMRYFKQRGFKTVKVIAYQNGDRITLSDAKNIPFVD